MYAHKREGKAGTNDTARHVEEWLSEARDATGHGGARPSPSLALSVCYEARKRVGHDGFAPTATLQMSQVTSPLFDMMDALHN